MVEILFFSSNIFIFIAQLLKFHHNLLFERHRNRIFNDNLIINLTRRQTSRFIILQIPVSYDSIFQSSSQGQNFMHPSAYTNNRRP